MIENPHDSMERENIQIFFISVNTENMLDRYFLNIKAFSVDTALNF